MNPNHKLSRAGVSLSFLMLLGLLFVPATPVWAQSVSGGTVLGQITDSQNAAIADAEVILLDVSGTSAPRKTASNAAGRYVFANVPPGNYDLTVSKAGFRMHRFGGQKVTIGVVLTLNATLEVGSVTQAVEVTATLASELQTTNATVGTTLSGEALMHLPNMGRDVSTLMVLQPGITPSGQTAGAAADQNVFTLDGGNNSDDMAGNNTTYTTNFTGMGGTQTNGVPSGVLPTPIESIEEFKVNTFNQTADFNSSIGSEVKLVTKRGTNQFHGSGYGFYYATNVGAANTWKNNHTPFRGQPFTPLPSNHRSRFGGSIGGPLTPRVLGGKTYFFFLYEGSRFPNSGTYERPVPTALMRAGVIQVPNAAGTYIPYNLNSSPVTVNGVTYQPAGCGTNNALPCDPRGVGLNPIVKQLWDKFMPLPNNPLTGDRFNTQGFLSTIRAPLNQNLVVGRIDHDFGDKWRFMSSYRFMRLVNLTTSQVDIGGALPGNTFGQPAATAPRTQVPGFFVAGLTTNVTPAMTNSFVYNNTRNFWQWGTANAPPQLPGLGGAIEIGGETANALIPYNVNTQSIRQRFWDGKDQLFRDDITWVQGSHLFQFGGSYQRNFNFHMRTDNGQGINNQIVYQITNSGINFGNANYVPSTVPASQLSTYASLYSQVLGLVNQPQVVYTRSGADLKLEPVGSVALSRNIIPYYNVYFTDTWHVKPTVTVTYGLGYAVEMPPFEQGGKQSMLVGPDGKLVYAEQYLAQRKSEALAGKVYNPNLGFAINPNAIGSDGKKGVKYGYDPFYGGISPRISAAWNPNFSSGILGALMGQGKTVIRGGYGRIYGRVNGVNQVLIPLLGPGLLQAVSCQGASRTGQCLGTGNVDPSTAFRIGTDGLTAPLPAASATLSQPFYPGIGGNAPAGDVTVLDPTYRPERTDNFSFTIQRALSQKMSFEVGYVGRIIKNELQLMNLDAVPYMTTLGGQSFAQAYAKLFQTICGLGGGTCSAALPAAANIPVQPFFEAALGGPTSAYCRNFSSCTVAVATNNLSLIRQTAVSDLWARLNVANGWTLGRTMISSPIGGGQGQGTAYTTETSLGYGNYNALFFSFRMGDWHGVTATSNFTWGRALGTATVIQATSSQTALDPWNQQANYGTQGFDIKFLYNYAMYYQPPFYKSQRGVLGRLLGGWTFSPIFTAQSGPGLAVTYSSGSCTACQSFGQATPPASTSSNADRAVSASPFTGGNQPQYNNFGSGGVGTNNPEGINMFADPAAVLKQFRPCVLGLDSSCGGTSSLRGAPRWNVDLTISKDIKLVKERVGANLIIQITNVMNHMVVGNPALTLTSPTTFGRITAQANTPRNMEFGLRIHF